MKVNLKDVCNFSKVPLGIYENPLIKISKLILSNSTLKFSDLRMEFPLTLGDMYGIKNSLLDDYSSDSLFFPWIHNEPVVECSDVCLSIFSNKGYFKKTCERLRNLMLSVREHGYLPLKFSNRHGGNITGCYLEHNALRKFQVWSGNHRVAVLTALGYDEVDVAFRKKEHLKPRDLEKTSIILACKEVHSSKDILNWPSVSSGFLKPDEAKCIISSYFE